MIIINGNLCEHCSACTTVCPSKSIYVDTCDDGLYLYLDRKTCTNCATCIRVCPVKALKKQDVKNS